MKDKNGLNIYRGHKIKLPEDFGKATGHDFIVKAGMRAEPQVSREIDLSGKTLIVHKTLDGEMVAAHDPDTSIAFEFWKPDDCEKLEVLV